ncbi:hypothetical protein J8L70_13225 [Pseudoalteromonas sp. MMG010]|uniref:hypothetical protein n=1 Tax=Pseudoalteromonas sp. MMG010 TaxID=2822685 RepID=UPI001B3A568E|nr:hypothetical protein [Pseudoalteromonas sp. MMG010]MBQ4834210.1 hypothetical protein [Pseudoalteromonas sp. MMG010]
MELAQDSHLALPLFIFDETLSERDVAQPDLEVSAVLNEELLSQLCQNPAPGSSIAITLTDYQLTLVNPQHNEVLNLQHSAQLTITHGPLLNAVLNTDQETMFVSPQVDMMPTFDLGDEDE